jgi:hypothetical protein
MDNEEIAENKLLEIASTTDLDAAIKRLERRKAVLEEEMKDRFHELAQDFMPKNILKNTLHEVRESTELKNNLLKVVLGLGAGYFSRKLLVNKSAGFVKKAFGAALQYGITNFIAKKNDGDTEEYPKKRNLFRRILSI